MSPTTPQGSQRLRAEAELRIVNGMTLLHSPSPCLFPLLGLFSTPGAPVHPTSDRPRLAVLAPFAWRAPLEPYLAARATERPVEFASIEEIVEAGGSSAPGSDAPERLKRWLHAAWKERDLGFVLLVGDCDVLPVRFMVLDRATKAAADRAFYASDLYYADVANDRANPPDAFDDWNGCKEGPRARYFGEVRGETLKEGPINADAISYRPELAVGRWPVSDVAALQAVIAKTLAWQPRRDAPRVLTIHADGWIDARGTAQTQLDRLAAVGFTTHRQFFGDEGGVPTVASVSSAVATGVDLLLHLGHGFHEGFERCLGPAEVAAAASAPAGVWLSIGCNTASFCTEPPYQPYLDEAGLPHRGTNQGERFLAPPPPPACLQPGPLNATGIGERLLRLPTGGAVAYLGCNTGAQPCALTLMDGFTAALAAAPSLPIGEAWRRALLHYVDAEHLDSLAPDAGWYPPSVFFQGMKFMFFGDPTLRLRAEITIPPAGAK